MGAAGLIAAAMSVQVSHAAVYPFEIFTDNGPYCEDPNIILTVEISDGNGIADFTFYNSSSVECSITGIYFHNGSLLGISSITNGPGTLFDTPASPGDLPGGELLVPNFVTTEEFSVDGDPPPPGNGVNPGEPTEWVTVTFDLINGGTLEGVIGELNSGVLRIGLHITAFPGGSSESAVNLPEPTTLSVLIFGALLPFLRRSRR